MAACLIVACVSAETLSPYIEVWKQWKSDNEKIYNTRAEEASRFKTFVESAKTVQVHNLRYSMGLETYTMGLNQFADMTNEEYKASMLTPIEVVEDESRVNDDLQTSTEGLPSSVDWVNDGVVTHVKNQGQCGSCWSFAGTGALEGQYALKYKNLLSFSEQQQVDCNTYCYGCNGGWAAQAFHYWEKTASNLESAYPYQAHQYSCRTQGKQGYAKVSTYYKTKSKSESALQTAVANVGPIAIAIDASHESFQRYSGGIYYESACSQTSLDHAVLAVGYGSNSQGEYWLVKNSWGTSWGDNGYIYMSRNRNNNCGVSTDCTYPVVA